jgi:predicted transcriptional regulator
MAVPAFSLRLPVELRDAVRQLAEAEGISQNELLEQAAAREIVARGALRAHDLERSAAVMRSLAAHAQERLIAASITAFVRGEAHMDPIATRHVENDITLADVDEVASALRAPGAAAVFRR